MHNLGIQNKSIRDMVNYMLFPLIDKVFQTGDVKVYDEKMIGRMCENADLTLRTYVVNRKGRLHYVIEKNREKETLKYV